MSAFDRADHESLDKIFLQERIYNGYREGGYDKGRNANGGRLDGREDGAAGGVLSKLLECLGLVEHTHHESLEGDELGRSGVYYGVKPGVPLSNAGEDGDGR